MMEVMDEVEHTFGIRPEKVTLVPYEMQKFSTIGHTANHCKGIPAPILVEHQTNQGCLDCLIFNDKMSRAGLPRSRWSFTDHKMNSSECPTKRALLKKMKKEVCIYK